MKRTLLLLSLLTLPLVTFSQNPYRGYSPSAAEKQAKTEKEFLESVDFSRFKIHLQHITEHPHIAGTPANEKVRDYLFEASRKAGWKAELYPYDVYLPIGPGESAVEIIQPIRQPLNQQEYVLKEDPFSAHPDLLKGWNAYSGSGDVIAEVVYVNYGTKADFERLEELGISVEGKIVIARYGANFRGYKAKFAEQYGAAALLIYTDPWDSGYSRGLVYPEGTFYNESAIQRGSLITENFTGDPLTPFEPALPLDGKTQVQRLDPIETALHKIPVTPIPYGSAKEIMQYMKGRPVPSGWQGGLPFTYRLEGGEDLKVRVMVDQKQEMTRIYNVIATLEGTEYPDEWIILGCHYDAWAFGATDPNSGTAMLLSLTETLGEMAQNGIRPKRSILIGHWDAEEQGVIGSTEWVEQMKEQLGAKAIAYMNFDMGVAGTNFGAAASPTLKEALVAASKTVQYPGANMTVFEKWAGSNKEPGIGNLGGGSDHIAFYMHAGIPSLSGGTGGPTLYHTNYDSFHFYEKFVDPTFTMGGMVEQMAGIIALRLANADVIPYDVGRYAKDLKMHFESAEKMIAAYDSAFSGFKESWTAIEKLEESSSRFASTLARFLENKKLTQKEAKQINQQMIQLEKSFLDEKGMDFGQWYQSLYASTDPFSGYASWILPGIRYEAEQQSGEKLQEWDLRYAGAITDLSQKIEKLTEELAK